MVLKLMFDKHWRSEEHFTSSKCVHCFIKISFQVTSSEKFMMPLILVSLLWRCYSHWDVSLTMILLNYREKTMKWLEFKWNRSFSFWLIQNTMIKLEPFAEWIICFLLKTILCQLFMDHKLKVAKWFSW